MLLSRSRFHRVSPTGPKKSWRMLLSTPTILCPCRSKCSTASEPIRPLLLVTRIVFGFTSVPPRGGDELLDSPKLDSRSAVRGGREPPGRALRPRDEKKRDFAGNFALSQRGAW